jgi:hypothetical protein
MQTSLCKRLSIELPIIQAPMAGAVGPPFPAAVSSAGGLGMLPVWRAFWPWAEIQRNVIASLVEAVAFVDVMEVVTNDVLLVIYAAIFFRGAGRCSLDRMLGREF